MLDFANILEKALRGDKDVMKSLESYVQLSETEEGRAVLQQLSNLDCVEIEIINKSNNPNPAYETPGSAGMDVRAALNEPVTLKAGEIKIIPTGLYIGIPLGYECQLRPRSGLSTKGISLANCIGTIDSDYKNSIGVIMINHSKNDFVIEPGTRIAQMVFCRHAIATFKPVEVLSGPDRGGGLGHTGLK